MIVYDLFCAGGHRFEAWFRSSGDFDTQVAASAVACPRCGDTSVSKAPTPMHVARGRRREPAAGGGTDAAAAPARQDTPPARAGEPAVPDRVREALQMLRRHVESSCDYVGRGFAEEARRIHYGETDHRNIYGEATPGEAKALHDEGVSVQPLPWFSHRDD
jgi:hypothetical protein